MERHPLIFLGVVVLIAASNLTTLGVLAALHYRIQPITKIPLGLRSDVAGLIDLEETNRHGH